MCYTGMCRFESSWGECRCTEAQRKTHCFLSGDYDTEELELEEDEDECV